MLLKPGKTISLDLPLLLLIISYVLVSFAQLQRIQLSDHVAFYAHDFFISLFVLVTAILHHGSIVSFFKTKILTKTVWKWLIIFLGWSILGLLVNQLITGINYLPWLYLLRLIVYLSAGLLIYKIKEKNKPVHQWLALIFTILMAILILLGFAQYLFLPDLRFLVSQGWDDHYYRLAGSMLDPNFLGMMLMTGLLVWLFKIAPNNTGRISIGILFIAGLLLTYSRSSYLVFFIIVVAVLFMKTNKTIVKKIKNPLLLLTTLFIFLIPFLPKPGGLGVDLGRTETITLRTNVDRDVLAQIKPQDLVIGKGLFVSTVNLGVKDQIVHANFPNNLLIFILVGTGIPGLGIFCYFLWQLLSQLYRKNELQFLLILGILAHSMVNLTVLEPINLLILMLAINI